MVGGRGAPNLDRTECHDRAVLLVELKAFLAPAQSGPRHNHPQTFFEIFDQVFVLDQREAARDGRVPVRTQPRMLRIVMRDVVQIVREGPLPGEVPTENREGRLDRLAPDMNDGCIGKQLANETDS